MINPQKGSAKVFLLVVLILLLVGAGLLFYKNTDHTMYDAADFSIGYSDSAYALVNLNETLPPDYKDRYSSVKLISQKRESLLGKDQCSYGASGLSSVCTVEMEGGISFVVVGDSVANLTSKLDTAVRSNRTISGKQVVIWEIGAEGEGTDYYYIPISQNKTLVVNRLYRTTRNDIYEIFPSNEQFEALLATLRIK